MAVTADQATAMAFLSLEACDNSVTAQEILNGNDWTALSASQLGLGPSYFDANGFFEVEHTQALVAIKGDTIALAIRGSDEAPEDFEAALHDQFNRPDLDLYGSDTLTHIEQLLFFDAATGSTHSIDVSSLIDLAAGTTAGGEASDGQQDPAGDGPSGNETSTALGAGQTIAGWDRHRHGQLHRALLRLLDRQRRRRHLPGHPHRQRRYRRRQRRRGAPLR
jgi:hypothetical protein